MCKEMLYNNGRQVFIVWLIRDVLGPHAGTAGGNGRTTEAAKKRGATPATEEQRDGAAKSQPCRRARNLQVSFCCSANLNQHGLRGWGGGQMVAHEKFLNSEKQKKKLGGNSQIVLIHEQKENGFLFFF